MSRVKKSIKRSSETFINYVWPQVAGAIGGGELIPVEGVTTDKMSEKFDQTSGIDFWQIMPNDKGIRGIANRCQPIGRDHGTFTIRRSLSSGNETEYHKRLRAISGEIESLLYPAITIQAYLKGHNGPLLSLGCIKTRDLFDAVQKHKWPEIPNKYDGNTFLAISWYKLIKVGYDVKYKLYYKN